MLGQCNGKGCSLTELAFGLNRAAVDACNPLGNGQAQPGAAAITGSIRTEETLENMGQVFSTDADAVVTDGQQDSVISLGGIHPHIAAGLPVLDSIFRQVQHQLREKALVGGQNDGGGNGKMQGV